MSRMTLLPKNSFRSLSWASRSIATLAGVLLLGSPALAQTDSTSSPANSGDAPTDPQSTTITTPPSDARFSCEVNGGDYTVMYRPQSQPGQAYAWAQPTALGGGWSADRRCAEISRRLEFYRPDGLVEMRTSVENGYDIICVTTEADPTCRIVLTVPPGQDPIITRDRVFGNLTTADSGQQTQAVTTFDGSGDGDILNQIGDVIGVDLSSMRGNNRRATRSGAIDLRPFLDPADGGTGEQL